MAVLLAMYQKMRLIREINQDTLNLTKISSKINRVSKNIEKVQKHYTGLIAQLDKQAQMMQSQATVMFQNMAGLGTNSVNLNNFTGMNGYVCNIIGQMLSQGGFKYKDADGAEQTLAGMSDADIQAMMNEYMSNGGQFIHKKDGDTYLQNEYENFAPEQVAAFTQAMRMGQMQQQQAQLQVQNASQQYSTNVSIWLEAAKAEIEAQQDAALEPLNYEDTMLQLEKEQLDARLQRLRAEKESYDSLVSEESKNMAPSFGLR